MYLASILTHYGHVASRSLFFDVQIMTHLFGKCTLFACAKSIPLPGYAHIFQQYLEHPYLCIHVRWDVREALVNGENLQH